MVQNVIIFGARIRTYVSCRAWRLADVQTNYQSLVTASMLQQFMEDPACKLQHPALEWQAKCGAGSGALDVQK